MAAYETHFGGHTIHADVVNGSGPGDGDDPGYHAYLDIYVTAEDPSGPAARKVTFAHPPVETFTGDYSIRVGDESAVFRITSRVSRESSSAA